MSRVACTIGGALLAALLTACAADYYRLPRPGGAEGSIANEVDYAFFSMARAFGLPYAYTEFNPDVDEAVIFYAGVSRVRRPFAARGVLLRPDGTEHASFTRTPHPSQKGPLWSAQLVESFPMTALRPHLGRWTLKLFLDDVLVGTYPFVLADKAHIGEYRRSR
jgi:hypothetical protein